LVSIDVEIHDRSEVFPVGRRLLLLLWVQVLPVVHVHFDDWIGIDELLKRLLKAIK
jgi:hypothetical protein